MKTFWDFCAPFYDFAEKNNGITYAEMLKLVPQGSFRELVPQGEMERSTLEVARI